MANFDKHGRIIRSSDHRTDNQQSVEENNKGWFGFICGILLAITFFNEYGILGAIIGFFIGNIPIIGPLVLLYYWFN